MTKSRVFKIFAFVAMVVCCVCGQAALAQNVHHLQARTISNAQQSDFDITKFDQLFQLVSGFGALPPVDGGGFDEWPCFPNPANPNYPDCQTIAAGGAVIGTPAYTWSYANCDASAPGAPNCGQIFWFYEDDTGDNTDPLVVSIVAKQGTKTVLDTGNITLANPNPFPAGSVIVISDDAAFGTLGQTGKGNGFCAGTKVTCSNPLKGSVTITVTTVVGASKISSKFSVNLQ